MAVIVVDQSCRTGNLNWDGQELTFIHAQLMAFFGQP